MSEPVTQFSDAALAVFDRMQFDPAATCFYEHLAGGLAPFPNGALLPLAMISANQCSAPVNAPSAGKRLALSGPANV